MKKIISKKDQPCLGNMNRRIFKPKFRITDDLFNRIVGSRWIKLISNLLAMWIFWPATRDKISRTPHLPERARRNGGFDFNMNSQLQVDANIGDKLKLPINYNTLANFNFENQLKLIIR